MKHLVITGAPHSGKTTRARAEARDFDVLWDWDAVAAAVIPEYDDLRQGELDEEQFMVMVRLRETFLDYMRTIEPEDCRAIVTVVDRHNAERIAGVLDAELIDLGGR